jgi:hypothetical protein
MHRKLEHRVGTTPAARPRLPALFVRASGSAPGESTSLKTPVAANRADCGELQRIPGNGVGLKSCLTPFVPDWFVQAGSVSMSATADDNEWRLAT